MGGLFQGLSAERGKGIAAALKVSNPSLRHLGSYARIAIQISEISPERH
jgi:hypothetical protein